MTTTPATIGITITYGLTTAHAECFILSCRNDDIKELAIAGGPKSLRVAAQALNEGGRLVLGNFKKQKYQGDDFGYKVRLKELEPGYGVAVFRSLDPRCLWTGTDAELLHAISADPYESPLVLPWMPAMRAILNHEKLIFPLRGHEATGCALSPELTPVKLDRLVSRGVAEKKLVLS